jgi:hypothetical protein
VARSTVCESLARLNLVQLAIARAQAIPDVWYREQALQSIVAHLDGPEAVEVARTITEPKLRLLALQAAAKQLARSGSIEEATAITREQPNDREQDLTLLEIAETLAQCGYSQQAAALVGEIAASEVRSRALHRVVEAIRQSNERPATPASLEALVAVARP